MSTLIFSINITKIRHSKRMSQQEMADGLGIGVRRYAAWEEGRCYPKVSMMIKLCDFIGDKNIYDLVTKPICKLEKVKLAEA